MNIVHPRVSIGSILLCDLKQLAFIQQFLRLLSGRMPQEKADKKIIFHAEERVRLTCNNLGEHSMLGFTLPMLAPETGKLRIGKVTPQARW
jgi:hypothetical protein